MFPKRIRLRMVSVPRTQVIRCMPQILLAEDNKSYATDLAEFLDEIGHPTRTVTTAETMWAALSVQQPDVLILDLGLPDEDGFNLIPRLRQHYPDLGVMVLTARVTTDNRVLGLRLGADAYLTKPIKFLELAAHIEALCRRIRPQVDSGPAPEWRLRSRDRQLELKDGRAIHLSEKEFAFLHLLALNTRPLQRESLLIGMGARDDVEAARKLDMLVYRLRKKTRDQLGEDLPLMSSYGEGYCLATPFELA